MNTHNIPFLNFKKENHPKLTQTCNYGICSKGPKNEFETAVENEPSVFEPSSTVLRTRQKACQNIF